MFRALIAAYLLDSALHLLLRATGSEPAGIITKSLAMPLLAAAFAVAAGRLASAGLDRSRTRLLLLVPVALLFSWLGDSLPWFFAGDTAFLVMVGGFLIAQVCYIAAFAPQVRSSILGRRRPVLTAYLALFVALVATCLPGAGSLAPAVVVYGITLVTMAILATGIDALAWIGGALFFVSDGLIALGAFADFWPLHDPAQSLAVMSTYLAAQLLLVLGVLRVLGAPAASRPAALRRRAAE